ncbi:MAG: response regulator [Chitinophagaceae bacterium]
MPDIKIVKNGISKQQEAIKAPPVKSMHKESAECKLVKNYEKDLGQYGIVNGLADLFYHSAVVMCIMDTEGQILSVNPAACKVLQYDEGELLGKFFYDFMPEKERLEYVNIHLPSLKAQGQKQGVLCMKAKYTERIYLLADNDKVEKENMETCIICFAQDITARICAEEKLMEEKRVSEISASAKQNFLANLSHEIRTPMNGILSISSLLGKTALNDRQHNFLKLIQDSANNLLVIVNDVLDLEKIVAGKLKLEKLPFKIVNKIANIVQSFIYRAEEKGLSIVYQNTIPGSLVLLGDQFRLAQVLNNLLNNALKFTEKGRIIITTRIQSIAYDVASIECSIKDTGIGINEHIIKKIFDPFVQANSSISRKYGGTGLGLNICKNLVEIQDGTLSVQSEENTGSIFTFKIPYLIGDEDSVPEDPNQQLNYSGLGKKKILVVEDMELNQFIARHIMESWGFEVSVASNGSLAINMVKENDYDLVLMDIEMPEMNGILATQQIRKMEEPQKANLPIIALTGNSLHTDSEKYIAAGMNGYLAKPLSEAKLFEAIAANLKNDAINSINMKTKELGENIPALTQKLYDLSTIRDISGGDEEFVQTMVALFIETVPVNLKELNNSLQNQNWDMVSKTAHKLKSTLDSMGIHSIGQDIRIVEQTAKSKESLEKIPALVWRINDVVAKCIEQIQKDLINNQ